MSVTIAAIDLAARRMDLVITDARSREAGKAKSAARPARDEVEFKGRRETGADRRSRKSRERDKAKGDFRQKQKDKKRRRQGGSG